MQDRFLAAVGGDCDGLMSCILSKQQTNETNWIESQVDFYFQEINVNLKNTLFIVIGAVVAGVVLSKIFFLFSIGFTL